MRRSLPADAEIADGAHEPLAEMVLPNSVDDDPSCQRASSMVDVGDPISEGSSLQRALRRWRVTTCGCPIIFGTARTGQDTQKAELDLRFLGMKITSIQQPGCFRLG